MLAFSFAENRQFVVSQDSLCVLSPLLFSVFQYYLLGMWTFWNVICLIPASGLSDSQGNTQLIFFPLVC